MARVQLHCERAGSPLVIQGRSAALARRQRSRMYRGFGGVFDRADADKRLGIFVRNEYAHLFARTAAAFNPERTNKAILLHVNMLETRSPRCSPFPSKGSTR